MNIKSGDIMNFESYSQFSCLKDFNNSIEMWLSVKKREFSKGELVGLKRLIRYAAKVPGVSNAKIGTILKSIHEEYQDNGISRSTFKRMVAKAKALGILTVLETERKNGSQSSNLYIFNRFPVNEPPKQEKMTRHNKTSNLIKTNKQIKDKRYEVELDHTFVHESIPKDFVTVVKSFFPTAKEIEEFWRMTTICAYRNVREDQPDTTLFYSIQAFKQLVRALKINKPRNPIAYYYGILNKKFEDLYFEELAEMRAAIKAGLM